MSQRKPEVRRWKYTKNRKRLMWRNERVGDQRTVAGTDGGCERPAVFQREVAKND